MKHWWYVLLAICIFICLILILWTGLYPKVYQISDEVHSTPDHANIEVIRELSVNTSSDIVPVMQDLLDYSGTIAVKIRKQDLKDAGSDLVKYQKRYHDLNSLIIKFDMNESEVSEFANNARQQNDILVQLINTSDSLLSLKKLEVQYHEDNDRNALTSIQLQGKALEDKIRSLNSQYKKVSSSLTETVVSDDLKAGTLNQGINEIEAYTRDVSAEQNVRERRNPRFSSDKPEIVLLVNPKDCVYGDSVEFFGYISGDSVAGQHVGIIIDDLLAVETITDDMGLFRIPYTIRQIPEGNHTIFGVLYTERSFPEQLFVFPDNSSLNLSVQAVKGRPEIILTGSLFSQYPVQEAPVLIQVDNETRNTSYTDNSGCYFTTLSFPEGRYIVRTVFTNDSFPLNGSQSREYEIVSTGTTITSIAAVTAGLKSPVWVIPLLICSIFALSGVYIWKKGLIPAFFGEDTTGSAPGSSTRIGNSELNLPVQGDQKDNSSSLQNRYIRPDNSCSRTDFEGERSSVSMRAYLLYVQLVTDVGIFLNSPALRNLTPREFSQYVRGNSHDPHFPECVSRAVRIYETIRYGGSDRESDLNAFTRSLDEISSVCQKRENENHRETRGERSGDSHYED